MNSAIDQRRDGDAVARDVEKLLVGFDDQRNVAPRRFQHQRTEHDQERHRQRGEGGDQRVADRFQPQPVPAPRLDHRIGAVERDAQALDAVGGEIHREHRRRWSARRRAWWSARRGFRRTANRRPASARPAASVRRPGRRVPWSRKSRPARSARSGTETAPSASTARYGWRSPSRHRRETCRTRPSRHDRRSESASHFTLVWRQDGSSRRSAYHLILLDKKPDRCVARPCRAMAERPRAVLCTRRWHHS